MCKALGEIKLKNPDYYHREYSNDIPSPSKNLSWSDQSNVERFQRVTNVALPFLTLYKPLGFSISLGLGYLRTLSNFSQLIDSIQEGNTSASARQLLQTSIAAASLVSTVFAHPLGMLVTTGQDLLISTESLAMHLKDGKYKKAAEDSLSIINNSLYLAMCMHGGLELSIASLGIQVLAGLYHAQSEMQEGRYLETAGHAGMAVIRAQQMTEQTQLFQYKRIVGKILALPKELSVSDQPQSAALKAACPTDQRFSTFESYSVEIKTLGGFSFHIADYPDGARVVTCLDGKMKGYQALYVNGIQIMDSWDVTWYSNYFIHKYVGGCVYSCAYKQVIQVIDLLREPR